MQGRTEVRRAMAMMQIQVTLEAMLHPLLHELASTMVGHELLSMTTMEEEEKEGINECNRDNFPQKTN